MEERLKFLVDTNVWLELLLKQERALEARNFFNAHDSHELAITDFSVHSIGIILINLKELDLFLDFLRDSFQEPGVMIVSLDTIDLNQLAANAKKFGMDFDDAYQYSAAEKYDLRIVSFDRDFDRTEMGRKTPAQV